MVGQPSLMRRKMDLIQSIAVTFVVCLSVTLMSSSLTDAKFDAFFKSKLEDGNFECIQFLSGDAKAAAAIESDDQKCGGCQDPPVQVCMKMSGNLPEASTYSCVNVPKACGGPGGRGGGGGGGGGSRPSPKPSPKPSAKPKPSGDEFCVKATTPATFRKRCRGQEGRSRKTLLYKYSRRRCRASYVYQCSRRKRSFPSYLFKDGKACAKKCGGPTPRPPKTKKGRKYPKSFCSAKVPAKKDLLKKCGTKKRKRGYIFRNKKCRAVRWYGCRVSTKNFFKKKIDCTATCA